jgi:DNA-binding protein HU-beta
MTKAELVDIVAEKVPGVTKAQVGAVYEAIFETIVRAVKEDASHRYAVKDFGTFRLKETAARSGKVPGTDRTYTVPAAKSLGFSPASNLKDALNK